MIQDIHPHTFENTYKPVSNIGEQDFVFYFRHDELLLIEKVDVLSLPQKKDLMGCPAKGTYLFTLNGTACFWVDKLEKQEGDGYVFYEIKFRASLEQKELDWAVAVAFQLKNWYKQNRFCGVCGTEMGHKKEERALECTNCGHVKYPTISPAIIVAILDGEKILLARGVHFPEGFFSIVAGYLDIGESIEDAVMREVKEEVGLEIKNIRYYKSQPWPFSGSMMMGFVAEVEEGQQIKIDGKEIIEAAWYSKNELPNYPPDRSIAGEMIDKFVKGEL